MRHLIEYRLVLSLAASAVVGALGLHAWPFPSDNPILGLIAAEQPGVYAGFTYTYAVLWCSTPFFASTRIGTMTPDVLTHIPDAIHRNENILVSGGTSTGKTTLLNALSAFLPANDHMVLIKDTAELQIERPNLVRFEARREQARLR